MSVNFDLMEKDELQRLCVKLFKQFEDCKKTSIDHLQRLKDFEIEKDVFIEKIKSLEDDLMKSKLPLDKSFNSDLSIDKVASVSHAMSIHRTMFVKPSMSHTQFTCGDKRASHSIPTCHHCGISGHIRPNCFWIRSQKPWNRSHVPRVDEPGFENQVKNLSDQVEPISKKLGSLSPNEQRSVLANDKKKTSKQVWVKKEDNLCLVAHTALKILDTCLWLF
jgi:hypothetical protein